MLNRKKSKLNNKFGCSFCNLDKIEIDKSDKTITLNERSGKQNICISY